jgi:predicted enzyme related to lactoylglutathione lyase
MIKAVKFIGIPVKDQNRALEFYTKKVGFQLKSDNPLGEQRWIELLIPGAKTYVVLFGKQEKDVNFMNMSFTSQNVQKTYEELKARGVEFIESPQIEPWGIFVKFKDTEGNILVITSSN